MSQEAAILESLKRILSRDFEVDPNALHLEASLKEIAIDSLAVIEIMFAIEEEFGITVPPAPPDARSQLDSVGDLVRYIDRIVTEQRGAESAGASQP